jgi:tetratricopeptide (TPR) repeat protein
MSKVELVSARARVFTLVALAAAGAAGTTVAATLLSTRGEHRTALATTTAARAGAPPLLLDLGVRTDAQARALRTAAGLYDQGRTHLGSARIRRAEAIFSRYSSLEAQVGAALAAWPAGAARLQQLARDYPRSGVVQLHDGLGLLWLGRAGEARAAWKRAKGVQPDSSYAVRASDLLHPADPIPGLPFFVPDFPSPPELERLSPPRQLAFLATRARTGGVRAKLLYGVALQRLVRPASAERQFEAAARMAPRDPQAQVAAAVGLFDKDAPQRAFGRLGPLTRTFPHAPTVRFHLGVLLLWLDQVDAAKRQFRLARADAPSSLLGKEATRFLGRLAGVGTNKPSG